MVLSNKKLKHKIRSLLAESVAAAEARDAGKAEEAVQQLQGLKGLLSSKNSRGDRPTRRSGKRRRQPSAEDDQVAGAEGHEGAGAASGVADLNGKNKGKRKRGEDGGTERAAESTDRRQEEEKNVRVEDGGKKKKENKKMKMKKKKKKQKQKQKTKGEKEGEGSGEVAKSANESGRSSSAGNGKKEAEAADVAACCGEGNSDAMRKVYVGGIPYYSTEDDIRSFFDSCGTITEVDCMTFPESGKFRGIAILTFQTEAAAKRALALDGADMGGLFLKVQSYKANRTKKADFCPEVVDGYYRIYAGNLSWDITEEDLRSLFSACKIASIRFGEDKATGEFKGYAHIDFGDSQSHSLALELDQKVVCGRPMRIRCAVPAKKAAEGKQTLKLAGSKDGGGCGKANREDAPSEGDLNGHAGSAGGKKRKRQTCYVCGVAGHLSSSCPQKKVTAAADGDDGGNATSGVAESKSFADTSVGSDGGRKTTTKKKRQTCYVCGVPGHLSSSCPQKAADAPASGCS